MPKYNPNLKHIARSLRTEMTAGERLLWSLLRRKQLLDVQFYRQKPIGDYVVDFYAPKSSLVVEVDGPQHLRSINIQNDACRDAYLASQGLRVLRFSNEKVSQRLDAVVDAILKVLMDQVDEIPLTPFNKGGLSGLCNKGG